MRPLPFPSRILCAMGLAASLVACQGAEVTSPVALTAPESGSLARKGEYPVLRATAIAGAFNTSCAIAKGGSLLCWGWNAQGQVGDGTTINRNVAVPVATSIRFEQVTVGMAHGCALTKKGAAYCWGQNFWGTIGDGTRTDRLTPVPVAGNLRFKELVSGQADVCGLTYEGEVYCWGFLLGTSNVADPSVPQQMSGTQRFTSIAHTGFLPCGIGTDGVTYCFEPAFVPELGNVSWRPVAVPNAPTFTSLSGQHYAMCGLTAAGVAYCWGEDVVGHGNLGSPNAGLTPTAPVEGNHVFTALYSAYDWTCGVTTAGENYCWGANSIDTFGPNLPYVNPVPVAAPFPAGLSFATRASGWQHTCGIAANSEVYCWGVGSVGQLADGVGDPTVPTSYVRGTPEHALRLR